MINLKKFDDSKSAIFESQNDEWIIRKLDAIIKKTKKIPANKRWSILVGISTTLLTLQMFANIDLLVKSIGDIEFESAFKETKRKKVLKQSYNYTALDLDNNDDFDTYAEICQMWIDKQTHNHLGITGKMMARSARKAFKEKGNYVPPELALSQATNEGAFHPDPTTRAIRTRNPFNVGNVDSGENRTMSSVEDGIQTYYNLIAGSYLSQDVDVDDLLQNFVRIDDGSRYAKDLDYESNLSRIMRKIKNYTEKVLK